MSSSRKMLVQMAGAPGSGKSTVANLLAQSINGVVISHDLIKSFFLENDICFEKASKLTYDFDWVLAEDLIKQGRNVIIDSTCYYEQIVEQGSALARKYGLAYEYIECKVGDLEVLDGRLRSREPMRSQRAAIDRPPPDATADRHKGDQRALFKQKFENSIRPPGDYLIVDSTDSREECLGHILKHLGRSTGSEGNDSTTLEPREP